VDFRFSAQSSHTESINLMIMNFRKRPRVCENVLAFILEAFEVHTGLFFLVARGGVSKELSGMYMSQIDFLRFCTAILN
jgi:hypothetical protein